MKGKQVYFKGDLAEIKENDSINIHGGWFFKITMLEGHKKGKELYITQENAFRQTNTL